jgi:hypothetical protein
MKTLKSVLISVLFISGLAMIPACSTDEDPTTGILNITVMDSFGNVVVDEQVFLATSLVNLQSGNYYATGWTNLNGSVTFMELPPTVYWYDTADWEDFGAAQVYAGIEHFVILWVNTPQP